MELSGHIVLSKADPRPMYGQIMEQIRQLVAVGDLAPGQEMPSIRQLAVDLQISVITVRRAYMELERDGVIVTQQGKGSVVAEQAASGREPVERDLDRHLDEAIRLGGRLGLETEALVARLRERKIENNEETS